MGKPGSHGCIRMRNADVAELFELVPPYTEVEIKG
jgi:lipoprotein-anchoring transpeptidase ErfK/SrfK